MDSFTAIACDFLSLPCVRLHAINKQSLSEPPTPTSLISQLRSRGFMQSTQQSLTDEMENYVSLKILMFCKSPRCMDYTKITHEKCDALPRTFTACRSNYYTEYTEDIIICDEGKWGINFWQCHGKRAASRIMATSIEFLLNYPRHRRGFTGFTACRQIQKYHRVMYLHNSETFNQFTDRMSTEFNECMTGPLAPAVAGTSM